MDIVNMVEIESDFPEEIECLRCWGNEKLDSLNPQNTFSVALTDNEILVKLSDFPKFHPMTGEPLSFPKNEDEDE